MNQLFASPTSYTADFEEAWQAYKPPKNSTKFEAYTAWQKTAKLRMHRGAFGQRMVECCRLYSEWIDAENVKRARSRQGDCPKKHFSSWLNARGWESFMPEAEERIQKARLTEAKGAANRPGWENEAAQLIVDLTEPKFTAWFDGAEVTRGSPTVIKFSRIFRARYVAANFSSALRRVFGDCRLVAEGSKEQFEI